MGDRNQLLCGERHLRLFRPPRLGRALNAGPDRRHGTVCRRLSALLGRSPLVRRALPYDCLLPPVMIDMIGRKRGEP